MRETIEFRLHGDFVRRYLPEAERVGKSLGNGFVYQVKLDAADPLVTKIGRLDREVRVEEGSGLFAGWDIRRQYSKQELAGAELLHARILRVFEPAGEECGTVYDEPSAFADCGAGAKQLTPLYLDGKRIPRSPDFAQTIAGEIVTSRRAMEAFAEAGLSGAVFDSVLVSRAGAASEEHFQLTVVEPWMELSDLTRAGEDPFDESSKGRCPAGHVVGLKLLSEVTVVRASLNEADVAATRQMIGIRMGLLRPQRILLLSPKARHVVERAKLRGLLIEVAHLD